MQQMKYRHKEARMRSDVIFDAVNIVLVCIVVLVCAYPIYYTIVASFSDPNAVITGKVFFWPVGVTLDSYRSVMRYSSVWTGYRNTLFYTVFWHDLQFVFAVACFLWSVAAKLERQRLSHGLFRVYHVFQRRHGAVLSAD